MKSASGLSGQRINPELKTLLQAKNTAFDSWGFRQAYKEINNQVWQILTGTLSPKKISLRMPSVQDSNLPEAAVSRYQSLASLVVPELIKFMEAKIRGTAPDRTSASGIQDMDNYFRIELSNDETQAYISQKSVPEKTVSVFHVKQYLEKNSVVAGIKKDLDIEAWLYNEAKSKEKMLIAEGRLPVSPKNGEVRYYFATHFRDVGRLNSEGRIDFRERGKIPHVKEGELLASKIAGVPGKPGMNVKGQTIPVPELWEPPFIAGAGTGFSEDQNRIHAKLQGQPHLDVTGKITVCQEVIVRKDVDFESGNIDFNGNVVVQGAVKQGFKVKCVSLTAREICGAEIDISGDLNVSMGIVDTELVNVKGNIQAKFIRNSKINAFGDLLVHKEIIDSQIYLSGACINDCGLIVNSVVSAKLGISAGIVGNVLSRPSKLIAGIDEQFNRIMAAIDTHLSMNRANIKQLDDNIAELNVKNQELHATIAKNATVQQKAKEAKSLEEKKIPLIKNEYPDQLKQVQELIRKLSAEDQKAEEAINRDFQKQNEIHNRIDEYQLKISEFEQSNKALIGELESLRQFSLRTPPLPRVAVYKQIESKTRIRLPNASKILTKTYKQCVIQEEEGKDGVRQAKITTMS